MQPFDVHEEATTELIGSLDVRWGKTTPQAFLVGDDADPV
jgi:hypothetical protein